MRSASEIFYSSTTRISVRNSNMTKVNVLRYSFSFYSVVLIVSKNLHTTFVFAMWPASEAARCPAKPNVGFIKILKFNWSPGHSANMLLAAARSSPLVKFTLFEFFLVLVTIGLE